MKLVALLAVLVGLLLYGLATYHPEADPGFERTGRTTTCFEDQPCWDCKTMGNKVCGTK